MGSILSYLFMSGLLLADRLKIQKTPLEIIDLKSNQTSGRTDQRKQWTVVVLLAISSSDAHGITGPTNPSSFLRGRAETRLLSDLHISGELTLD